MFNLFKRKSAQKKMDSITLLSKKKEAELVKVKQFVKNNELTLRRSWQRQVLDTGFAPLSVTKWDNETFSMLLSKGIIFKECTKEEIVLFITDLINKHSVEAEAPPLGKSKSNIDSANRTLPRDPIAYENMCADLLRQQGWQAKTTSGSGDQGVDVWACKQGVSIVIQCKLYSKPVGNKAVQEALSGMAFEKANFAVVVAPNGFTRSAKQLAERTGVFLLSEQELHFLEQCVGRYGIVDDIRQPKIQFSELG